MSPQGTAQGWAVLATSFLQWKPNRRSSVRHPSKGKLDFLFFNLLFFLAFLDFQICFYDLNDLLWLRNCTRGVHVCLAALRGCSPRSSFLPAPATLPSEEYKSFFPTSRTCCGEFSRGVTPNHEQQNHWPRIQPVRTFDLFSLLHSNPSSN